MGPNCCLWNSNGRAFRKSGTALVKVPRKYLLRETACRACLVVSVFDFVFVITVGIVFVTVVSRLTWGAGEQVLPGSLAAVPRAGKSCQAGSRSPARDPD